MIYTIYVTICKFLAVNTNIDQQWLNFNPDKDLCKSGKSDTTKPDAIVSASNVINFVKSRCIKHLVSDRLLSLISTENVHNVT
jgi:hypothetical protein